MTQNARVEVSPVMLRNEINKRHITLSKASLKMGYSDNYLNVCMDRGFVTKPAMIMLEQLFGIKEEDICTPKVDAVEVVNNPMTFDHVKLYNTIYSAVKNAMRDALNEGGEQRGN